MAALIKLSEEVDDNKAKNDINTVITRLQYARSRDLSTVLYYLHLIKNSIPNKKEKILALIPSQEEISEMLKEDG